MKRALFKKFIDHHLCLGPEQMSATQHPTCWDVADIHWHSVHVSFSPFWGLCEFQIPLIHQQHYKVLPLQPAHIPHGPHGTSFFRQVQVRFMSSKSWFIWATKNDIFIFDAFFHYYGWFIIGSYQIVIIYSTIQCTYEFSRVLHTIYGRNRSGDPCNGLLYSVRNWVVWPLVSTKEPGSCMLFKCLKYFLVYLETRSYSFSNQTTNTAMDHKYPHQSRKWRDIFGSFPPFEKVSKRCPILSFTVRYSNRTRTKPTVLLLSGNKSPGLYFDGLEIAYDRKW